MNCNQILLNSAELSLLEEAAAAFLGQDSRNARERFRNFNNLRFEFVERERGRSGRLYDLFFAGDEERNIAVVFESENGAIRDYHIRSYTKSHPEPGAFQEVPVTCFLDQRNYFEYVQTRIPAAITKVDGVLSFSEASGLFLHRETTDGSNGEMIFLQKPSPQGSLEADLGVDMSPNIPIGFCVLFDANTRQVLDYKMPYQCNVDMALLARQFDEAISAGK